MAVTAKQLVDEARLSVPEVAVDDAHQRARSGESIIDVREPGEWEQGHIEGAIHVPRGLLEWKADPTYTNHDPRITGLLEQPLLVMCASGGRSLLAAKTLREMGYRHVTSVAGGFSAWTDKGLPTSS